MGKGHVDIIRDEDEKKEYVATVENKHGQELGKIYYNSKWKKFIFDIEGTYFDSSCLSAIASRLTWLDIGKKDGTLKETL